MERLIIADILSNNVRGTCSGHFFAVADNYMDIFNTLCDVKIAGGPIYRKRYDKSMLLELPCDHISGASVVLNLIRSLANCWVLFRQLQKGDIVIMQQSADLARIIGLALFGRKRHKIFVIQYSNQPMQEPIRRFIYQHFAKKRICGTICPSNEIGDLYGTPYIVVPDYIYTQKHKDTELDKIYDFCIIGRLNKDKGVDEAVKILKNQQYRVLVAGKADVEYQKCLKDTLENASNIELKIGYMTDEEYDRYIRVSRYCILNYKEEYSRRSSGVVFDVVFRNTPIIGRRCKALQFVEEENLGILYDDISKIKLSLCFEKETINSFKKSILLYKKKHNDFAEKLMKFIIGN